MKRLFVSLIVAIFSFTAFSQVKHWKHKVYYIPPEEEVTQFESEDYLLFETPLRGEELLFTDKGTIILRLDEKLLVYGPSLRKKAELDMRKLGITWKFRLLAADPGDKYVIVGIPLRDEFKYRLVSISLPDMEARELLTLADSLFPGYAPVAKERRIFREDPDFFGEFRFLVAQSGDFRGGFIRRDTLYLWTRSEPGIFFGQLIAIPLRNPRRILLSNRLHHLLGYDSNSLVYSIYTDPDGIYVSDYAVLRRNNKEIRSPQMEIPEFVYYRHNRIYANPRHTIKVYTLPDCKVREIPFPGEGGVLMAVSPSGNRLFGVYYRNGKRFFGIYDVRKNAWTEIDFPLKENKPPVKATYDGESFALLSQKKLYLGYLNDDSRPVLSIHAPDTVHTSSATVKIYGRDRAFVSGLKEIRWQGKTVKPGESISVSLKEGENIFQAEAPDRAGNKKVIKKKMVYLPQ